MPIIRFSIRGLFVTFKKTRSEFSIVDLPAPSTRPASMKFSCFFTTASLFTGSVFTLDGATSWNAAADFITNELSATELSITPNGAVTEWSYGFRDDVNSILFSSYVPTDHTNSFNGSSSIQGWDRGGSVSNTDYMIIIANVTGAAALGLNPGDMLIHPASSVESNTFNVVRWTAPASGVYNLSAQWTSVASGNGVDAHIRVVDGMTSATKYSYDADIAALGSASDSEQVTLATGDYIDFVLGPGAVATNNSGNDSVIFDADIVLVPEVSSTLLLAGAAPLLLRRRRTGDSAARA